MVVRSLLLAVLAIPFPAFPGDGPAPSPAPPTADAAAAPAPSAEETRLRRALGLLAGTAEDRARLVREAAEGPADLRLAALEALGRVPAGNAVAGAVEAALGALASGDPLLRQAGIHALLGAGDGATAAVEKLARGPVEGLPAVPASRARDALFDLRRAAVERDFLAIWQPDDGTWHGMYAGLRSHGAFGAKVLAAIALDHRMAAGDVLGYGPYAWFAAAAGTRDRTECRDRALEALADAGDAGAREMLRCSLRRRVGPDGEAVDDPARELFDETDRNPIPATLDDSLREAIAALGDPGPLYAMIHLSELPTHGLLEETIEMRRRAGAYAVLAAASSHSAERVGLLREAERLLRRSVTLKKRFHISVDGVEHYNLACLLARRDGPRDVDGVMPSLLEDGVDETELSDRAVALLYLQRSLETHSVSSAWLVKDGDLRSLHDEPEFKALVERLRAKEQALEKGLPR